MPSSRKRSYGAIQNAANIFNTARKMYKAMSGVKRSLAPVQRSNSINSKFVNSEYQQTKQLYQKRKRRSKLSRKKRLRIKKFKRRVRRIINGKNLKHMYYFHQASGYELGPATAGSSAGVRLSWPVSSQGIVGDDSSWGVYTGQQWAKNDDIHFLGTIINRQNEVVSGAIKAINTAMSQAQAVYMTKARHDINLVNLGDITWIYDFYQFVAAQDIADVSYRSPASTFDFLCTSAFNKSSATSYFTRGITPLDVPYFGQYWTLLKKERVMFPPHTTDILNTTRTFTMFGDKKVINLEKFKGKYAVKGLTKMWLLIAYPLNNNYTLPLDEPMVANTEKSFHYKILHNGNNRPNTRYFDRSSYTAPSG